MGRGLLGHALNIVRHAGDAKWAGFSFPPGSCGFGEMQVGPDRYPTKREAYETLWGECAWGKRLG